MSKREGHEARTERTQARLEKIGDRTALKTAKTEARSARKAAKAGARASKRAAKARAKATEVEARALLKSAKSEAQAMRQEARAKANAATLESAAELSQARAEFNLSIKARITIWFTLMVLLLTALVLVFVLLVNDNAAIDDPAGRLVKVVTGNANDMEFDHGTIDWDDLDLYDSGVYCVFYTKDGAVMNGALPEGVDPKLPFKAGVVRTVDVNGTEYYIYDYLLGVEVSEIWIRGAVSSEDHSGIMRTIIILTVTILPALLLLTAVGGWLIARSAFRPMDKIIDAANDISDGDDLSARVGLKHGPTEMKRLSRTFDAMFARLEASFNAERQFASDASHELRTPITIILAQCDRSRRKDSSPEDYKKSIAVIEEQGKNMSELVQSLLGLTRMQHGTDRYPLKTSSLSEFVSECSDEFLPADSRGIRLEKDIQGGIDCAFNPSLMSRVVQNLLQNAYKYGRDNGHIRISLSRTGDSARLEVRDDGVGIAPEDIDKVWQRFWQADASHSVDGGSGLGLAMVKEIASFHGGTATVESREGEGSTFAVTIPIR